jgi:hypothetical protein
MKLMDMAIKMAIILAIMVSIATVNVSALEAKITDPKDGATVSTPVTIEGTISRDVPPGYYMWVLVNPILCPGQYWPQGNDHITPANGNWSWIAYLGGNAGDRLNICVALVDTATDKKFKESSSLKFPASARMLDQVTVVKE